MSSRENVEEVIGKAVALEKRYDWIEARDLYEQALGAVEEEVFLKRGEVQERIGYCLHRAAFQAESQEEFKERMRRAVEAYEEAHGFYEKLTDEQGAPWMFRCRAIVKYIGHWLKSDPAEKGKLLDECLELEEKALTAFWDLGNKMEYGKTYNGLPLVFWHRTYRTLDRQVKKRVVEDGIQWGEKAVAALSELGDPYKIAGTYFTLATCYRSFCVFFDPIFQVPGKQSQYEKKFFENIRKAVEFSERVGDAYIVGLSYHWLAHMTEGEEARRNWKKMLECGEKTWDIFLKGLGLSWMAYIVWWSDVIPTEDPEEKRKHADEAMALLDKSHQFLSIMFFHGLEAAVIRPPGERVEYYILLAELETDPGKKLEFLDRSVQTGMKALKVAEDSNILRDSSLMHHYLGKAFTARANIEPNIDEKRSLLEKALNYRERNIALGEQWMPFMYWNIGLCYHNLAEIKAELAAIEPDLDSKMGLLEEAVKDNEKCLQLINRATVTGGRIARLRIYQDTYATILTQLYEVTNNPEHLRKAIEISRKAIESASKVEMVSRIAESYWKIAKAQATLGEHMEAAENFERASENYMKAAEKIPQLNEFYQDHATYMQAWSEIERARHHHAEKRYREAREHYENAAELHKSTERWNYLAPNYLAWARLEEAEGLSRTEQTQESRDLFEQAAKLFVETKESINTKQESIETREEKKIAEELVKASDVRHEYCLGRVALEEARILDRQGDHAASSRKYSSATKRFQKAIYSLEQESERKELRPIVYLCQAWEKMMMAEEKASSILYGEAAELFIQAREHALDHPTNLLAQANSSFCKALEAGTEFEITRDMKMHSTAKKHMEAAANFYLRAGFKNASEYARATHRLLDAYIYMNQAETETEPRKKVQYYQMAERVLQASAGSYIKARHPEKSEEVRRLLESVKEERQLAISLSEVLHVPTIASTTTSFSTPTPTHEQAVGLERFEHADIQANLILRGREVKVGDVIDIEIELVNAGKAPAQLIKVEEIIPEGFDVASAPDMCRVEDSYLDMKGRTLSPLKTVELKLALKPISKGTFHLNPRILYLDEAGKYKHHEPEPVTVTVKELGISGWLRGPSRKRQPKT